jgi:hypothetical protein
MIATSKTDLLQFYKLCSLNLRANGCSCSNHNIGPWFFNAIAQKLRNYWMAYVIE